MSDLKYVAAKCGTFRYKKNINFYTSYMIVLRKYCGKMC